MISALIKETPTELPGPLLPHEDPVRSLWPERGPSPTRLAP